MDKQAPDPRVGLAKDRTSMAVFRTSLALDRTTLAWIRTALTMATFGFGTTISLGYGFWHHFPDNPVPDRQTVVVPVPPTCSNTIRSCVRPLSVSSSVFPSRRPKRSRSTAVRPVQPV